MNRIADAIKRETGIVLCVLFAAAFMALAKALGPYFDGADWYVVSSLQRLLFGVVELWVYLKFVSKGRWTDVLHLRNMKAGFAAGAIMFLIILFEIVTYLVIGAKAWIDTTVSIVVSCLFLQQITTGFWEELTFRVFVAEGYYKTENKTKKTRFAYAFVSFVIFGLVHAVECSSLSEALYRFVTTGIWGFAFASIYLYSHNVVVAMLMHFVTNIPANATMFIAEWNVSTAFIVLNDYIYFVLLGIMFVTAVVYLWKEPKA